MNRLKIFICAILGTLLLCTITISLLTAPNKIPLSDDMLCQYAIKAMSQSGDNQCKIKGNRIIYRWFNPETNMWGRWRDTEWDEDIRYSYSNSLLTFVVRQEGAPTYTRSYDLSVIQLTGSTMGTTYNITLVGVPATVEQQAIQQDIDELLVAINQSMSTYIPDSELMKLNRADTGVALSVSAELFDVLQLSESISQLSQGAFDITVGPLVELWGFGASASTLQLPKQSIIDEARSRIGFSTLQLNRNDLSLRKSANVAIDLSAVAKGYGVDRVASLLESQGVKNYLVEIGGEIRLSGVNAKGKKWRIGIEKPDSQLLSQTVQHAIELTDIAIATSGNYRNFFEVDGKRYSHTIDPRTGWPIDHNTVSVTVLDKSSARADALATAFSVLGAAESIKVSEQAGIAAFFVVKEGAELREVYSTAFSPYL